jgi:hypothetical protein
MPVNRYFNTTTFATEQKLIDDLIIEAIQIYGHIAYYIPRNDEALDPLFGEDPLASFTDAREIEIYLKSAQSFAGQGDFISKFGLHMEDQATFLVSQTRFTDTFGETALTRPREGDILYIQFTPTNRFLFEIRHVEQAEQLFQLGRLYTYELSCEAMNYSHERVQTADEDVNAVAERSAYTVTLTLTTGTGSFLQGETVYQGVSFIEANATGTVVGWSESTHILELQSITGAFTTGTLTGVTSGAVWAADEPESLASTRDPQADNDTLDLEKVNVIVNRGPNPRF